jgi:YYY domain-containing protein
VTEALRFLALVEVVGLAATPLAALLLKRLPGGGLAFAKPLGLLVTGWLVWLGASLQVVPYGVASSVVAIVVLAAAGAVIWRRAGVPGDRRVFVWSELVFVVAFAAAALAIAYSPEVWDTEKPMDMAFINAVNASDYFPPHDPWMAGLDLNYYYFGHFLLAIVLRLSDVEVSAGYNLAVATTFALAATAAFALGSSLWASARQVGFQSRRSPTAAGLMAAFLTMVAGTMEAGGRWLSDGKPLQAYDWFGAARVIPDTINEFPAFSFNLADLHAHVLALPFTLLALGFALQLAMAGPRLAPRGLAVLELCAVALVVGALYAINTWSYPVAAGLVLIALFIGAGAQAGVAAWAVLLLALSVLLVLPFHLSFDPAAAGLGLVDDRRSFSQFVREHVNLYGLLLYLLLLPLVGRLLATRRPLRNAAWGAVVAIAAGSVLAELGVAQVALLAAGVAAALVAVLQNELTAPARFVWLLVFGGFVCLLLPEVVYVRDSFDEGPLYRMNTVFKMGYQAWVLLALAGAAALFMARGSFPTWSRRAWVLGALPLLVLALGYPIAGTYARKQGFSDGPRLNGLGWLERTAPGDVAAVAWLRENTPGSAVVLEAVGDDYSAFGHARISTFSGRATVMGWEGHEVQWEHDPGARRAEVERMYRETLPFVARPLLRRYGVDYVVVGPIERTDYGDAGTAKWDRLGRRVFESADTTVWQLR